MKRGLWITMSELAYIVNYSGVWIGGCGCFTGGACRLCGGGSRRGGRGLDVATR